MGFEPTTSTLARLRSTTELHPLLVHPRGSFQSRPRERFGWGAGAFYNFFSGNASFFSKKLQKKSTFLKNLSVGISNQRVRNSPERKRESDEERGEWGSCFAQGIEELVQRAHVHIGGAQIAESGELIWDSYAGNAGMAGGRDAVFGVLDYEA